jgi:hypothetical protein
VPEGEAKVTFERGAAFDDSTNPHPAVRALRAAAPDRTFVLVLIVGVLIGMVLSAIAGIGLYAFGWLDFGGGAFAPAPTALCAPTAAFLPLCPTCDAACSQTATPTPTPESTASPVPDFAATATQACSDWRSRFPATPCPAFVTPSP